MQRRSHHLGELGRPVAAHPFPTVGAGAGEAEEVRNEVEDNGGAAPPIRGREGERQRVMRLVAA
jgi:hypothetical protein